MALQTVNPTQTVAWKKLQSHFETMKNVQMQDLFANDKLRTEKMHIEWCDFLVDYSKNIVTDETIKLFLDLANEVHLKEAISKYFDGDLINQTENRSVLHTALRASENTSILVAGENIIPEIYLVKNKKIPKILFNENFIFNNENKDELFEIMYSSFKFNQLS